MPDQFGATTPQEEEELMLRAYYDAQQKPAGQRLASFQQAAPPDPFAQYLQPSFAQAPAPAPAPAAPPPGSAAANVNRVFAPYTPQQPSFAPTGVTIPEVNVAPRPGLPGTMPGQGGMPRRAPVNLQGAIRQSALGGAMSPEEQFNQDFAAQMGEEPPAPFQGQEGTVPPHRVGLTVKPLLPGEEQQLNEAENEGFAAQIQQGEAQIQGAQDIAQKAVEHADQQEAVDQQFAERELERQSMLRDREASFQQMADDLANEPIEKPSMWGDNTGENILNRIAVFLGGLGAPQTGGRNLVYDKLQKDVELNMQAQKERREVKLGRIKQEAMLIDMARERFKSEALVDATMREAAYRKLGAELERFKEFAKTPERKAALDALIAQNNITLSNAAIQRRQAMDADVLRERQIRAQANQRVDPLKAQVQRRELEARGVKADREIEGKTGEDVKAIRKAQADFDASMAAIKRYEDTNIDVGVTSSKEAREAARQSAQSIARKYQNDFLGKSDADAAAADKAFPEGGTLTRRETIQQAAQAARQRLKDKRDAEIKAAGGNPGGFTPQGGR